MKWGCLEMFNVGKSTKYKIYFSVWAVSVFIYMLIEPELLLSWNVKNYKEINISNPVVEILYPKKRRSYSLIHFADRDTNKSYVVSCHALRVDKKSKENFCDWYDGKNTEHKISSIQSVSIRYLNSNRKVKKNSLVNEIEFLDQNNSIQRFVVNKEIIPEQIKGKLSLHWWYLITLSIVFFPSLSDNILFSGNKERMGKDRNYEQLIALKGAVIFVIIMVILHFLTSEIVNLIFHFFNS